MKKDEYIPGNILFTDMHSLRTTNGISVSTIAGSPTSSGYSTSAGTSGRFNHLYGFYQKNRTHVIVADFGNACLSIFHSLLEPVVQLDIEMDKLVTHNYIIHIRCC